MNNNSTDEDPCLPKERFAKYAVSFTKQNNHLLVNRISNATLLSQDECKYRFILKTFVRLD
jgi:hypothetical protein